MLAATGVPADAYFGLVLMALVFIGGMVMTVIVVARNRRGDDPPSAAPIKPNLPDHPEQLN